MATVRGEKLVQDLVVQRPDGELIPLRMWAMQLPSDTDLACYAVVLRDRSQELRLEEAASERLQLGGLVGHGAAMQELFRQTARRGERGERARHRGERHRQGTGRPRPARQLEPRQG